MPFKNKDQQRAYMRQWIRSRRQRWLNENGPCAKCGSSEKLEVDHIDPAQKVEHRVWSWSEERRNAELAKCQVLCEACHAAKTVEQRPRVAFHGSAGMYGAGCRCAQCRKGNADSERIRRLRKELRSWCGQIWDWVLGKGDPRGYEDDEKKTAG